MSASAAPWSAVTLRAASMTHCCCCCWSDQHHCVVVQLPNRCVCVTMMTQVPRDVSHWRGLRRVARSERWSRHATSHNAANLTRLDWLRYSYVFGLVHFTSKPAWWRLYDWACPYIKTKQSDYIVIRTWKVNCKYWTGQTSLLSRLVTLRNTSEIQ